MENYNSSGIRQKGNLKTGVSRKQSALNFQKNEHFLLPACAYQGVRNVCFSEISLALFS